MDVGRLDKEIEEMKDCANKIFDFIRQDTGSEGEFCTEHWTSGMGAVIADFADKSFSVCRDVNTINSVNAHYLALMHTLETMLNDHYIENLKRLKN